MTIIIINTTINDITSTKRLNDSIFTFYEVFIESEINLKPCT